MDNKTTIYIYRDTAMVNAAMKINRSLTTLTLVSFVCLAAMKIRCDIQRATIYKMSKDIEELKKAKGE